MNKEPTESMIDFRVMIGNRRIEELETEKEKLEKALERACVKLSDECYVEEIDRYRTKDEWKDLLLDD